ncbi:hypothetical protein [Desulfotruncus alcoholivorax]|uniref:hypothetical protein n=1 Tax=Desulfotruncus alcoholivorax TaxID=265477 RepID=UPI00040DEA3A|nr:hypothetical protein [Desulfotruncus alcoholivorax]
MINACRDYLVQKLYAAGIADIRVGAAEATKHQARLFAEIVFGKESLKYDGSKVAVSQEGATKTYRRRIYSRIVPAKITIAHRDETELQSITALFLASLDRRLLDGNGNCVLIDVSMGDPEEDTGAASQRERAAYVIEFLGGVYKDNVTQLLNMNEVMVIEGEIENG